ncbi:Thiamine-phosphate synthase [Methanosarcinaceae archaeon Ag5]|uniref:Thiamine-phosphate synthase n=1 Tax=Methanolapillus africanus TaxID=3028297 RepID=A0AAE4MJX2_9EURY|nr:Thiamine-phosphate synthase [Methanosarcinaceae archaeon Ag5]
MFWKNKSKKTENKDGVDYSVYVITDSVICPPERLLFQIEEAVLGGATVIQLREKKADSLTFYKTTIDVYAVAKKHGVPLIINDRTDMMLAAGCDGLHIGQKDLPAAVARKLIGQNKILGVSVSTADEAKKAVADGADYLGVGAVFPTGTKDDADSVSLEMLKEIKETVGIPVVAIGGISKETIPKLTGTNIDGVAVVSAVMGSSAPKNATEEIKSAFDKIRNVSK